METAYTPPPTPVNIRSGLRPTVGDSSFPVISQERRTFVDKSLLIAEVIDNASVVSLILRPRRFGKSLNLSMLKTLFDLEESGLNRVYFQDLLIERHQPDLFGLNGHFGRYPVVNLDLKDIRARTWSHMLNQIRGLLARTYTKFYYLLESSALDDCEKKYFDRICDKDKTLNMAELNMCLKQLTEYLTRHHGQPCVVLVDEYDTPLQSAHPEGFYDDASLFFHSLFSMLLKGNGINIYKAVLVGITHAAKSDLLSDSMIYTFKDYTFSDKFGFTSQEVDMLLKVHQPKMDIQAVKSWYCGYESAYDMALFNPWSIMCLCSSFGGIIQNYWVESGSTARIIPLIASRGHHFKESLSMLLGHRISPNPIGIHLRVNDNLRYNLSLPKPEDEDIWTLLYFAGYLAMLKDGTFYIPNMEISIEWLGWVLPSVNPRYSFQSILEYLICGDILEFARLLSEVFESNFSFFDGDGSSVVSFYNTFVLGIMVLGRDAGYDIKSNDEDGRFGILLRPQLHLPLDSLGIILEFKNARETEDVDVAARQALELIREKKDAKRFVDLENVCEVGIGLKGKMCSVQF
ncbi:hypothetical protein HDU79_006593 [Rhizoclosmatium sp. JEL0117]|nr:hypothetical protein HDU79_006593 [Rhizoclosmatium sp. JEL0117]